jgi:hypothetical protein
MDTHEVISAFLDNEDFDAGDLARALAQPGGRELLLDLVALRTLVQDDGMVAPALVKNAAASARRWVAVGFLAASIVFGAGAAWLLPPLLRQQRADVPPRPDRVITFETAPASPGGSDNR